MSVIVAIYSHKKEDTLDLDIRLRHLSTELTSVSDVKATFLVKYELNI